MDKYFSEQDARRIIDYNKNFISNTARYFNKQSEFGNAVSYKTSDIFNNGGFELFCEDEIIKGKSMLSSNNDLLELIRLIYGYRVLNYNVEQLRNYYDSKIGFINNRLQELSYSSDSLKWFFSSSELKNKAIQAYEYFNSPQHFEFFDTINKYISKIESFKNPNIKDALADYYRYSNAYGQIVCKCNPNVYYSPKDIKLLKNVFNIHEKIYCDSEEVISSQKKLLDTVIDDIYTYIEFHTMDALRNTPIEAIKKSENGLKIKTLRDNGICSVADLFEKIDIVECIQGIGELTATKYQNVVLNYYNDAKRNIRIRLNYDNKDEISNQLILSLYRYIRITEIANKLYDNWIENEDLVRNSILSLEQITNGIQWLFYTPEQKLKVNKAFVSLKMLIEEDDYHESQVLIGKAKYIENAYYDEAWNDYNANTILYNTTLEQLCDGLFDDKDNTKSVYSDNSFISSDSYGLNPSLAVEINDQNFDLRGLKCSLRKYQIWGLKFVLHQKRVLLGDEMGLGKTVQAIAAMVALRNVGLKRFCVICPASVLQNWFIEIKDKSDLLTFKLYGSNKEKVLLDWINHGGVLITTYDTLKIISLPDEIDIDQLVVDEAHYIKNPNSQRTQTVNNLVYKSQRVLFMTGTALENRVDEMINLIDMLNQDLAEELRLTMYSPFSFKNKVMPVYYRRRRDDVLQELPDLIEINEWCQMTNEDIYSYSQEIINKNFMQARRVSWNVDDFMNSSKANRLFELLDEVKEDGRKVIIFSYFLETLQRIKESLGDRCMGPIDGSVSPIRRQEIINEFSDSSFDTVLVAQIQTGGTGLNIQAASVVIICEPQLKPSIESQAISRVYRMGQNRNVFVYRLLCSDSIDERIIDILSDKQDIFNEYADESYAADQDSYEIQQDDLKSIKEKLFIELMNSEYNRFCDLTSVENMEGDDYGQRTYNDGQCSR